MTAASLHVTQDVDDLHIAIAGEIDLTNRDVVADQLHDVISNQTTSVVIDLTGVSYLDSSALRLLFTLADRLRILQVQLALIVPRQSTSRRIVELSGLDQLVEVQYPDRP